MQTFCENNRQRRQSSGGTNGLERQGRHPPTYSLQHCIVLSVKGALWQNYDIHHHHGNLQLEEKNAVEGMAHGPGEEEMAKQMKVGLQTLCLALCRLIRW